MSHDPLAPLAVPHVDGYHEVPASWPVARQLERVRVIDVREPHELTGALGRIAGAEVVPIGVLRDVAPRWDRSRPLLVVCRSGKRAGAASAFLRALGFQRVYNLAGGMLLWNERALPAERAGVAVHPPQRPLDLP